MKQVCNRILAILAAVFLLAVSLPAVLAENLPAQWDGYHSQNGLTQALTPRNASEASLKWRAALKSAEDWATAVSEPLLIGGQVYIAVGNQLLVLDGDGNIAGQGDLAGAIGYTCRPLYADGRVMVPLADGSLQALAADSLTSLWLTEPPAPYQSETGPMEHQALTTLTGDDGRVYMGTACADWTASYYGVFRCINTANGEVVWEYVNSQAGYYWSGAARMGDALLIAGDDGILTSLDALTGEMLDTYDLGAPVRSTLTADGNTLLAVSTDGVLHKLDVTDGKLDGHESVAFASTSTGTPTVWNGMVYVGGCLSEEENYAGVLAVVDLEDMAIVQRVTTPADVKAAPLVTTGYGEEVYAYFTANTQPGGVYVLHLGEVSADAAVLYTPQPDVQNYCMASVIADENGVLYYTNDSGTLFAIESTGNSQTGPSGSQTTTDTSQTDAGTSRTGSDDTQAASDVSQTNPVSTAGESTLPEDAASPDTGDQSGAGLALALAAGMAAAAGLLNRRWQRG